MTLLINIDLLVFNILLKPTYSNSSKIKQNPSVIGHQDLNNDVLKYDSKEDIRCKLYWFGHLNITN